MNNIERIAEIEKRCAVATPGPWETDRPRYRSGVIAVRQNKDIIDWICHMQVSNQPNYDNDAEFIARSREDIPYLLSELDRHKKWVNDLQSGMYVNCVYCGHRYGLVDEVPASMADALKEHIENCPEHPMSELKAENVRLAADYDRTLKELDQLRKEVIHLAIESVEREKQLAKLEAEVQYWADAEKDGRLVVLPCKIGDVVYKADYGDGYSEPRISECIVRGFKHTAYTVYPLCDIEFFGKTVFLTRAEAKAALLAEGVSG